MDEYAAALQEQLDRLGIRACAVVVPTPWDIGPVACYLFPDEPVTLIDCGVDSPEGRAALTEALHAYALEPSDVKRILVTHVHTDHFGGALWLQPIAACEVLLHPVDIAIMENFDSKQAARELFMPLGFDDELLEKFTSDDFVWRAPEFVPLEEATYETGTTRLRVEHRPGHTPGHVWLTEERTGAIFVGDYLLADHPTNAGLEIDRTHGTGRAPLLERYNAGLRELREREAPVLFPAHGPPIVGHAEVIERRLAKSDRRTRHVLGALRKTPHGTALDIGRTLYGARPEQSWEVLADVVGRLDLLVAEGRATTRMGEDGAWHFEAVDSPLGGSGE